MKIKKLIQLISSTAFILFPIYGNAQTYETNSPEMVIKNLFCSGFGTKYISADLINRGPQPFNGVIKLIIVDKDGDIAWQGGTKIQVGPLTGQNFNIFYQAGSCASPNRLAFKLE